MSIETPNSKNESATITDVVFGIVSDFHKLALQQLSLLRAELRSDWQKAAKAMRPLLIGGILAILGAILLAFAAAFGLHWAMMPADSDPARIPLWGCLAIVGGGFFTVGGILFAVSYNAFQSLDLIPKESIEALDKNLAAFVSGSRTA